VFTGIVTAIGTIRDLSPIGGGRDMRVAVATPPGWLEGVSIGASICCSGCCLTVVTLGNDVFEVEISAESLSRTTLGGWREGSRINLERSLRLGDEMGGHVVSGHVDGVAEVLSIEPENGSQRWTFRLPSGLPPYVAEKGSIAVDGVSLTVNAVEEDRFGVNLIPHTAEVTALGALRPGGRVNIEIDMLARYVARLAQFRERAA
jgi:riboflavin synthase